MRPTTRARRWRTLYNLFFPLFRLAVRGAALFVPKIRATIDGRISLFETLEKKIAVLPAGRQRVWIHAASVGEFEQARPIIERLREQDVSIIVSFLSVSGYEARKNFPHADLITYLPEDVFIYARRFVTLLAPDALLVMRYDFWFNHLFEAAERGVRLILVGAVLDERSAYLKPVIKNFYRSVFGLFDFIYTVSERDAATFRKNFPASHIEQAGDTRFDQVTARRREAAVRQRPALQKLTALYAGRTVVVAGSTWAEDESMLVPLWSRLHAGHRSLVLVPHEVGVENIERIERLLTSNGLRSEKISTLSETFEPDRVLIVDQVGYLAELYAVASITYIGGGFGVNVHNVLEAAVYGVPVIYGHRLSKSPEAQALADARGGFIIHHAAELERTLTALLIDEPLRIQAGHAARIYVDTHTGATDIIFNALRLSL